MNILPARRPVVAIACDQVRVFKHPAHAAFDAYVRAVVDVMGAMPLLLPALGADLDVAALLGSVDGVLLTGSPSNVEPVRYGAAPDPGMLLDTARDATTLPAIPRLADAGLPLFGVCRGLQEMNVAFGGTLHQAVHELPGFARHREDPTQPVEDQYAPSHEVRFTPGGLLERISGHSSAMVNSVHSQGVDRLAEALAVEAVAPDGLVEAFTVRDAPGFTLAVQWHPEWRVRDNELSMAMFTAFGDAARNYVSG